MKKVIETNRKILNEIDKKWLQIDNGIMISLQWKRLYLFYDFIIKNRFTNKA